MPTYCYGSVSICQLDYTQEQLYLALRWYPILSKICVRGPCDICDRTENALQWKQCLGRSCMLAPKLICTYPFPVLYAFVRTGVLSIALLTLTNPKNIGNSQKTKKNNIPRVNPRFHSFFGSNLFYCPLITLLSHPWITLNPTVEVSNWGLRAKRISDKMAKRAVSCTWATVEGVLMGAVFRGRSTLQAEFLNPWASQLEQSYCALQGLLDLNRKHPKSMKFLLDSRVSCVCWSRLLYHSEKEHAYTMQYSHSPANFMRFPLKSQNYFYHPG